MQPFFILSDSKILSPGLAQANPGVAIYAVNKESS